MHRIKGNVDQRETIVLEDNEHIHLIKEMLIMPVFRYSSDVSNTDSPVGVCFLALFWKIVNLENSILRQDSVVNRNAYILSFLSGSSISPRSSHLFHRSTQPFFHSSA